MFWRSSCAFFSCPTCRPTWRRNWKRPKRTTRTRILSQHTVHISTVIKVSGFQTTSCAKLIGKKRQLADVDNSSVLAIAENFKRGEWKAVDIVMEYLQRIHEMDKVLSAFLSVDAERALYKAQLLDEKWDKGEHLGPLAAVPVAIKDNLCTKGMVTTAGSKMLETFVPAYDATSVARLEAAGAIILGKTNMDEFGMGSSTELSGFHPSKNPWDPSRVCGGSSGGSAGAVSSGMAPFALGSDTGGSIRQPASFCGISGLKPTYDTVGPMACSVAELATIFQILAGRDPMDPTSWSEAASYSDILHRRGALDLKDVKLGVVDIFSTTLEENQVNDVMRCFLDSIRVFTKLNAQVVSISLPYLEEALAAYYVIAPSEASSNLARFDGVRFGSRQEASHISELYQKSRGLGMGAEVKRRMITGTFALSSGYYDAYYRKALQVRQCIIGQFEDLFRQVDVILCPTTPCAAFELGERMGGDPVKMYREDVLTIPPSLAGLPALSIPMGFDANQLPLGLQLIGNRQGEDLLFRVGHAFQMATDWHRQRPPIYRQYVQSSVTKSSS